VRHQYTPIFRDLLTSSLWASATPATRCVWMTLLLLADPEGYVPAAVPGLALAANVTVDQARLAIAELESPDPDSRTEVHEGRRIQKVDHGWRILNFVEWRARAVAEAEKARKRAWAKAHRRPANDNDVDADPLHVADSSESSETLDAPKPKPKPKPSSSEGGSPLPPAGLTGGMSTLPLVLHEIPADWEPSGELRAEATAAGVTPEDFNRRLADLRTGTIGGQRGVLSHKLDDYLRSQFGKWRVWGETDRAKAARAAQAPPGRAFSSGGRPSPILEPSAKHTAFATKHGLDVHAVIRQLVEEGAVDAVGLSRARELIGERLSLAARAAAIDRARAG
jgi:hypothetical protein